MVTTGKRFTPREIERAINSITVADIQRCAKTYLWDKDIAIAAVGQVEGLLDYNRIRAGKFDFAHLGNTWPVADSLSLLPVS
jgi:processing peptidase subunit beta